jgi:hypothetical protein
VEQAVSRFDSLFIHNEIYGATICSDLFFPAADLACGARRDHRGPIGDLFIHGVIQGEIPIGLLFIPSGVAATHMRRRAPHLRRRAPHASGLVVACGGTTMAGRWGHSTQHVGLLFFFICLQ